MWRFYYASPLTIDECLTAVQSIHYPYRHVLDKGRGYTVSVSRQNEEIQFQIIAYGDLHSDYQQYAVLNGTIATNNSGYTQICGRIRLTRGYIWAALLLFTFFPLLALDYGYYLLTFVVFMLPLILFMLWGIWDTTHLIKQQLKQAVLAIKE